MGSFFIHSLNHEDESGEQFHIILHKTRPLWKKLNNTALNIALELDKNKSENDIVNNLAIKYGLSKQKIMQDVIYVKNQLIKQGFLNNTKPSIRKISLKSVFLHLTNKCNLLCPHCYFKATKEKAEYLPFANIVKIIDELADIGGDKITLSGGEPLLHPDFEKIVEYASKKIKVHILTNGSLITKKLAAFFSDKNISVQVSIDGPTEKIHDKIRGKGSFKSAVRAIKYMQDAGLSNNINLCTTIMDYNINSLLEIVSITEKLGIPKLRFLPCRNIGRANSKWDLIANMSIKDYEDFFDKILVFKNTKTSKIVITCGLSGFILQIPDNILADDIWCPVGKGLVINTKGESYPCTLLMNKEFYLGNIFNNNLKQLLNTKTMKKCCDCLIQRRYKIEKCTKCKWNNFCQAGCMGQVFEQKNTIWDTDDFCDYRIKAYEKAFNILINTNNK